MSNDERITEMGYLTITRLLGDAGTLLEAYRRTSPIMDRVGHDHGLLVHAGATTADGLLLVNLWPAKEQSEAAAADPRRLAVLERLALTPEQLRKEHHELERYVMTP
jgi:hypothetical protein